MIKLINCRKVVLIATFAIVSIFFIDQANATPPTCTPNVDLSLSAGDFCNDYANSNPSAVNVFNAGTIATINNYAAAVGNSGSISSLVNQGQITANSSIQPYGVYNSGTISVLNNSNSIVASGSNDSVGIYNDTSGIINSLTNSDVVNGTTATLNLGNIISFTNTGEIKGIGGDGLINNGTITSLDNSGTIKSSAMGGQYGVNNSGTISTLTNSGSLSGLNAGLINHTGAIITSLTNLAGGSIGGGGTGINNSGFIGTLVNNGQISSAFSTGLSNSGSIQVFTNVGQILAPFGGMIFNTGTIGTLNNINGGVTLTYAGTLPTNYNIIINSPTSYGKLSVTGGAGSTTFGIYTGSTIRNGTYAAVLSSSDNTISLTSTSGKYGNASWLLSPEAPCTSSCIYDLIISGYYAGPSTADTQQSLVNTAAVLQNTYTLQNAVLSNSLSYDCNVFGANDVCISTGGRNTAVSAANGLNNTSALLIAGYRINPQYRIGAYADQNLSVNNAGSTVTLGNNTPLLGIFGAWSERTDDLGAEVKVSAAYGQKNTTITRTVVGTSEAGSGSSQLISQGAQAVAKYGLGVANHTIISPYVGVRYTQNNMGGYTEASSASVTAPLTYSALNTNATTALAGAGASYKGIAQTTFFASAGIETDTNTNNGTYSATGVTGLTPINFNANPVKNRATATLGAYYDIEKNQRLGITGIYRQEAYQAVQTTTVLATYTVGL